MRITDTLDQLLRSLATAGDALSAEGREAAGDRAAEGSPPVRAEPDALARDLAAAVDEVTAKRAHELARDTGAQAAALVTSTDAAESLGLGFHLGAAIERIAGASREGSEGALKLREATWLIERYIHLLEQRPLGADLHASSVRLARARDTIDRLHDLDPRATPAVRGIAPSAPSPAAAAGTAPPEPQPAAEPAPVVRELPSIRRELFVTAVRAAIVVVTIIAIVLALTLIADWR